MNRFSVDKEYYVQIGIQASRLNYRNELKADLFSQRTFFTWVLVEKRKIKTVIKGVVFCERDGPKSFSGKVLIFVVVSLNNDSGGLATPIVVAKRQIRLAEKYRSIDIVWNANPLKTVRHMLYTRRECKTRLSTALKRVVSRQIP